MGDARARIGRDAPRLALALRALFRRAHMFPMSSDRAGFFRSRSGQRGTKTQVKAARDQNYLLDHPACGSTVLNGVQHPKFVKGRTGDFRAR